MDSIASDSLFMQVVRIRIARLLTSTPEQLANLQISCGKKKITIFRDHMERPIAYVAWADVNKESARRFIDDGTGPSYPYEWNEGEFRLILDVVSCGPYRTMFASQFRNWLRMNRVVMFARRNKTRLYLNRRSGMFRRAV